MAARRRLGSGLIILLPVLATPMAGCTSPFAGGSSDEPTLTAAPAKNVRVVQPEPVDHEESYPSSLYVERDVLVTPRRSGVIEQVRVDRGRRVEAGETLAVLETDLASRELEIARQELRLAEAEFDRLRSLHDQRVVSAHEFLRAEISRDQAASQLALAEGWLERCRVRAPFEGVIVERWAVVGQRVHEDTGPALFRVVAREPLRSRVDVPEERLAGLVPGSRATLRVPGNSKPHPARVVFISPAIDPASGTAPVIVEVEPGGATFKLGSSVTVRFEGTPPESAALGIPREALRGGAVRKGDRTTVLVVSQGYAEARRVEVLGTEGGLVLVKGDLGPDDQIIIGAGPGLVEGDRVTARGRTS